MIDKTLILGVGNIWRQDDGTGPKIIAILQQQHWSNVDLIDGGTDGLSLLDKLSEYKQAIIIDAADMDAVPGTVKSFTPEEALIKIKADALSTHGFGLAELIKLMQQLQISPKLHIIGVQPKSVAFGNELTLEINSKIPAIIEEIACVMQSLQN